MVRALWRVSKCSLNYNISAVWYDDLGSKQYHKASKYFSLSINSLLFSATMISVSSNRLNMCSNSTCESHSKLFLYLLNNKVLSYSVPYIGEHCLCSLDKMPDKIQNSFSRWLSETISATIRNLPRNELNITLTGCSIRPRFCHSLNEKIYISFIPRLCNKTLFSNTNHELKYFQKAILARTIAEFKYLAPMV